MVICGTTRVEVSDFVLFGRLIGMTNPGLPPPLSSAHREREATRVIDLRQEIEDALADLDAAIGAIGEVGGQEGSAGGRAHWKAPDRSDTTKVSI